MLHEPKEEAVRQTARRYGLHTLVETGTYIGEMVQGTLADFDQIYSIELSPEYAKNAVERFANQPHVKIMQGDSKTLLPEIIKGLKAPAVFWLDAHYAGGSTAHSENPILHEIRAIFSTPAYPHVALVDDINLFGTEDFPTREALESCLSEMRPPLRAEAVDGQCIYCICLADPQPC